MDANALTQSLLAGERRSLSRLISWAEDGDPRFARVLAEVYGRVGSGWRVGVTGPPGAGKSTLANALLEELRARGETVGVLAIDPSSPFSGGALLGDRIRMEERTADAGVFIRSMASRGSHGGLARAAVDACDAMDAFGFDRILIETVGVGQAEYDVVSAADTVVVVLCPGAGDGIQAMKAGILEVADVLVVNKADLPGADRLVLDLEDAVHTRDIRRGPASGEGDGSSAAPAWEVPVVACSAQDGEGVGRVLEAVDEHRRGFTEAGLAAVRARKRVEQVKRVADEILDEEIWGPRRFGEQVETALRNGSTPYDVARAIVASILGPSQGAKAFPTQRPKDPAATGS